MRLIDADELKYRLHERGIAFESDIVYAINNAPVIDAVPVVRCAECAWREPPPPCFKSLNGAKYGKCILRGAVMRGDEYCSFGTKWDA